MGAEIEERDHVYHVKARRLHGACITLPYPSVTATENILMAAALAEGITELRNAAVEPEVIDLAEFLIAMGARISQSAGRSFVIHGVRNLHGAVHELMPDRLVAASVGAAAVATGGDVFVRGARASDLAAFLDALRAAGAAVDETSGGIRFRRNGPLAAVAVETTVHPGFMTDWHPPMALVMTQAEGVSVLHETVFEDRLGYTRALCRMGAAIGVSDSCLLGGACRFAHRGHDHSALIKGVTRLKGAEIVVPDLRAGFTHLIAALAAEGESRLFGAEEIDRGYERIDRVFASLGARIERRNHQNALTA
jgi:UDP-N-acetylglucosamine 1-carboxyvinyltransferase